MMFSKLIFLVLFSLTSGQQNIWTDEHVLQALGDHGDRLADLEKLVKNLTSNQANLQKEITDLKVTNDELLLQIKNLTESCPNYLRCSDLDNVTTTTTTMYSVQSTETTTTPMPVNLTFTEMSTARPGTTNGYNSSQPVSGKNPDTTTDGYVSTTQDPTTTMSTEGKTSLGPTTISLTTTSQSYFEDCADAVKTTGRGNGTYNIRLGSTGTGVAVYCEIRNAEAWLLIQRRQDGTEDFNRNWQAYKNGFGDLNGEFWLGNEKIHALTSQDMYTLRIDMDDWGGNHVFVEYDHFDVGSEKNNYRLSVGSYRGNAGDSFHYTHSSLLQHNWMYFSTPDKDNDNSFMNCADKLHSGWWFNSCYRCKQTLCSDGDVVIQRQIRDGKYWSPNKNGQFCVSNLNGIYLGHPYGQRMLGETSGEPTLEGTGIEWYPYRRRQYSMRKAEMKIKLANKRTSLVGRK